MSKVNNFHLNDGNLDSFPTGKKSKVLIYEKQIKGYPSYYPLEACKKCGGIGFRLTGKQMTKCSCQKYGGHYYNKNQNLNKKSCECFIF